jgi:hypothetical protein
MNKCWENSIWPAIEGLVWGHSKAFVRGSIEGCRDFGKGFTPVVLAFVDIKSHELFEGTNSAFHLAIGLMMVLGGDPSFYVEGFGDLLKESRGESGILVHDNAERASMNIENGPLKYVKYFRCCAIRGNGYQMGVRGQSIHDNKDAVLVIGFGEWSCNINCK